MSNNITRAEAVLSRADPEDLESLDLLVLPEMAFSGLTSIPESLSPRLATNSSRIQLQVARTHNASPRTHGVRRQLAVGERCRVQVPLHRRRRVP
jgi:hypothetical protein